MCQPLRLVSVIRLPHTYHADKYRDIINYCDYDGSCSLTTPAV